MIRRVIKWWNQGQWWDETPRHWLTFGVCNQMNSRHDWSQSVEAWFASAFFAPTGLILFYGFKQWFSQEVSWQRIIESWSHWHCRSRWEKDGRWKVSQTFQEIQGNTDPDSSDSSSGSDDSSENSDSSSSSTSDDSTDSIPLISSSILNVGEFWNSLQKTVKKLRRQQRKCERRRSQRQNHWKLSSDT